MGTFVIVGAASGVLFGVLDGVINANPLARRLSEWCLPVARTSLNVVAGVAIDLAYGFAMAGLFVLLYAGLPGGTGLLKGVSFALVAWFFRVAMSVLSQWMTFRVPVRALVYSLLTGLAEMLVLGVLYGLTLTGGWPPA
jgi:hypothetical protein